MASNCIDSDEDPEALAPHEVPVLPEPYGFAHVTVRFIGTILPMLALAGMLIVIMS